MKKATVMISLAFGLGFLLSTSIQAIHPVQISDIMVRVSSEITYEKEIALKDWMLSMEAFSNRNMSTAERAPELESWMYDMADRVRIEAWMLEMPGTTIDREVALEGWMLSNTGSI
jgi:hypothetical protein